MGCTCLKILLKANIVKGKVVNIEDYGAFLEIHARC